MKLRQKIFYFKIEDGTSPHIENMDDIYIALNDRALSIPITAIFEKINKVGDDYIKGYSIFQDFEIDDENYLTDGDVKITFFDNKNPNVQEKSLYISSIKNPVIQSNNINIDEDKEKLFNSLIIRLKSLYEFVIKDIKDK